MFGPLSQTTSYRFADLPSLYPRQTRRSLHRPMNPTSHPATRTSRSDQVRNRTRRGSRGGRPPAFNKQVYKHRNVVERCFNRLKQWRGIATRYDKTAQSYQAAVTLASLLMWA
ncbi:transposase [Streptomyces lavendulae]|uniref:transposase n=1 Tax=Streptomyces lavendulae TaxID=1914 RepID=UPI0037109AC9